MSRVNFLYLSITASLLLPASLHAVRPQVAYAGIGATALLSGMGIGAAYREYQNNHDADKLVFLATLWGGAATAGAAISLGRRLPAARILRARTLVAQVKEHDLMNIKGDFLPGVQQWGYKQYNPEKHALAILKRHKRLLQQAEQEVDGARADYRFNLLKHVPEDVAAAVLKADIRCAGIDVDRAIGALFPKK